MVQAPDILGNNCHISEGPPDRWLPIGATLKTQWVSQPEQDVRDVTWVQISVLSLVTKIRLHSVL